MKLTKSQEKALDILRLTSPLITFKAAGFALKMWPDSSMHTKHSKGGEGVQTGKAAWLCGGSYLAKLVKKGWVKQTGKYLNEFYISPEGLKVFLLRETQC